MKISLNYREVEIDFCGEEVTCRIKPLDFEAYQKVLVLMNNISNDKSDESQLAIKQLSNEELKPICDYVFKDHVIDLKGITIDDKDGEREATVQDITEHGLFAGLCMQLIVALINISTVAQKEKKN